MVDTQDTLQWVALLVLAGWVFHIKSVQVKHMSATQTEIDELNGKVVSLTATVNSLGEKVTKIGVESANSVEQIATLKAKIEEIESEEEVDLTEIKESLGLLEASVNNVVNLATVVDETVPDVEPEGTDGGGE